MPACLPAGCVAECHMHVTHEPWLLMKGASFWPASCHDVQGGQSIEIWLGCALQSCCWLVLAAAVRGAPAVANSCGVTSSAHTF
jgi:hypothetical protein